VESEVETPGTYSQRSILKWEVDEALGPSATISAVLYANMNHPELKRDHPSTPISVLLPYSIMRGA
jgi:hypothetical protein